MTSSDAQIWVGIVGTLVTIAISVLGVLNFQRRRDRSAAVGAAFRELVDALASENTTRQIAAAILMRRFFDSRSEQGSAHRAYATETIAVIASLLRKAETSHIQKVLGDGLRYAPSLAHADLQNCNLTEIYLGQRQDETKAVDLTHADLYEADLTDASLKGVHAQKAVFYKATLVNTVLTDADLTDADFREANLAGARFGNARIDGARFAGATDIPAAITARLDADGKVAPVESAK